MADEKKISAAPAKAVTAVKKDDNTKPGFFKRVGKWFRELKSECRKIVWPTREQTVNNTLVVLASVVIIGIFIWVLDIVFGLGIQTLLAHTAAA